MGQLMDWQSDPARGAVAAGFVLFWQRAEGQHAYISPAVSSLSLCLTSCSLCHPSNLISAFVSFASISHSVFLGTSVSAHFLSHV